MMGTFFLKLIKNCVLYIPFLSFCDEMRPSIQVEYLGDHNDYVLGKIFNP